MENEICSHLTKYDADMRHFLHIQQFLSHFLFWTVSSNDTRRDSNNWSFQNISEKSYYSNGTPIICIMGSLATKAYFKKNHFHLIAMKANVKGQNARACVASRNLLLRGEAIEKKCRKKYRTPKMLSIAQQFIEYQESQTITGLRKYLNQMSQLWYVAYVQ